MARDDDDSNSLAGNSPPGSPLPLSHLLLLPAHGEQPSADPESRQTTPSIDITPSPSREQTPPSESAVTTPVVLAAVVGSKRPAPDGDHSQFTVSLTRHFKLRKCDHDKLIRISQASINYLAPVFSELLVSRTVV